MAPAYRSRPSYGRLDFVCPRHHVYTYGVLEPEARRLVAYLWLYRSGELAMVSSILGHAEHLESDVMYLLFLGMLERQFRFGGPSSTTAGTRARRACASSRRASASRGDVEWALS